MDKGVMIGAMFGKRRRTHVHILLENPSMHCLAA